MSEEPAAPAAWDPATPGLLTLPSGRVLRGRGLGRPPVTGPDPDFAVYLLGDEPSQFAWEVRWVRWPDFGLPADRRDAEQALREAWRRAATQRVEIACEGGRGRTGTALACIAVLDGVPARDAVAYVRQHYHPDAVETPWQRRFVSRFEPTDPDHRARLSGYGRSDRPRPDGRRRRSTGP